MMPIPISRRKPGTMVVDQSPDINLPVHRRIFVVEAVLNKNGKGQRFQLKNVSNGSKRFADCDSPHLALVPTSLDLHANMDCLVGAKARVHHHSGSTFRGTITGIKYCDVVIGKTAHRQVESVEMDRSGTTTWPWSHINKIELL